jgi:hypothetical protein
MLTRFVYSIHLILWDLIGVESHAHIAPFFNQKLTSYYGKGNKNSRKSHFQTKNDLITVISLVI